MNISIIIPNYNGAIILQKNLPKTIAEVMHFTKKTKIPIEIIVVDDCSKDNSVEVLENLKREAENIDFHILVNERNKGFSSTVNRGVDAAKGEIAFLHNTDIIPEKNFLEPLLVHFKDSHVFAVACMDKSIEEENVVLRGRGIGAWKRGLFVHAAGELDKTTTLWASGGSSAFRKEIWDTLGGFDETYNPFYWEDIDLSYRAWKAGYTVLFEKKSIVVHEHSKGAIKSTFSQEAIQRIAYKNQFIFIWKNMTDRSIIIEHMLWLPVHLFNALRRGDISFFLGLLRALAVLPQILKSRMRMQKKIVVSDHDVVKQFAT